MNLTQTTHSVEESPETEAVVVSPTGLDRSLLDDDAYRAVQRLQSHGYEAYLVGGCVRDLLLGHRPKDFDIATSARPAGVKRTFPRNCRIIGRRFKLAHLHFHGNTKILEVSTFRRAPEQQDTEDEDLLITRDNEFGNAAEDAVRRDFTINALFYDPVRDELVDHAGGLADIEARVVRTIGPPLVRFREDPVRILRAIKFAGRLGLTIEPATAAAMRSVAPDLVRSAPPRLLEEILRLLRGGNALDAVQRMRDCGALAAILPTVQSYLDEADRDERIVFWRTLEALDGRAARAAQTSGMAWPPQNGVLLACLFHRPVQVASRARPERSPTGIAEELIAPFAADFRLPRRDTGCLKRICAVQHRFDTASGDGRVRADSFLRDPYFAEALELFEIVAAAEGRPAAEVEAWIARDRAHLSLAAARPEPELAARGAHEPDAAPHAREGDERERRRKKKRKRRNEAEQRAPERGREERHAAEAGGKKRKKRREGKRAERSERPRPAPKVETIEPEAIDLSAFDVELDPKRVPTFGTIVEGGPARKRRRVPSESDDEYRPPPPPGGDQAAPPPPPPPGGLPDTFGDW